MTNQSSVSETESAVIIDRPRFDIWVLTCLFSVISLAAYQTGDEHGGNDEWWQALYYACVALSISFGVLESIVKLLVNTNTARAIAIGLVFEGIISLILVVLWGIAIRWVLDPSMGMGQMYVGKSGSFVADYQATVSNANLYFMSWGAGLCTFVILLDVAIELGVYTIHYYHPDRSNDPTATNRLRVRNPYDSIKKLSLIMVASAVMMGESKRFENQVCSIEGGTYDSTCDKNLLCFKIGIACLAVTFFALVLIMLFFYLGQENSRKLVTVGVSLVLAVLYATCAAELTFGNGPATYVGNQYFSVWGGFFMSFSILGTMLKEFLFARLAAASSALVHDASNASEGSGVERKC